MSCKKLAVNLIEECSKVDKCNECKFKNCYMFIRNDELFYYNFTPLNYNVKRLSKNIRQYKRKKSRK